MSSIEIQRHYINSGYERVEPDEERHKIEERLQTGITTFIQEISKEKIGALSIIQGGIQVSGKSIGEISSTNVQISLISREEELF